MIQIKTAILLLFVNDQSYQITNYKQISKIQILQQITVFHQMKYKTLKYAVKFTVQFLVVSDTLTSSALVSKTLTWKS